MNCPVCDANTEQISTTMDGVSVVCPTCGEYDISNAVLAAEQWRGLEAEERCDVLDEAKRSARPGVRPVITTYSLA